MRAKLSPTEYEHLLEEDGAPEELVFEVPENRWKRVRRLWSVSEYNQPAFETEASLLATVMAATASFIPAYIIFRNRPDAVRKGGRFMAQLTGAFGASLFVGTTMTAYRDKFALWPYATTFASLSALGNRVMAEAAEVARHVQPATRVVIKAQAKSNVPLIFIGNMFTSCCIFYGMYTMMYFRYSPPMSCYSEPDTFFKYWRQCHHVLSIKVALGKADL